MIKPIDEQVELNVLFAPDPRTTDSPRQVVRPQRISGTPQVLRRLTQRLPAPALLGCFEELRGLPYEIELAPDARAYDLPLSLERFVAAL